jgi:hypothetical protein
VGKRREVRVAEVVSVEVIRRIGRDLRSRRNVEAYVVAATAVVFAVLSVVGDLAGENLRWAATLAALGLLVYRLADPVEAVDLDRVLHSRIAFDDVPFAARIRNAEVLWVYGPSAVNLISSIMNDLRRTVLARPNGVVRIVVLDPDDATAVALATRQLDERVEFPTQEMPDALGRTVERLERLAGWETAGRIEHRFAPFNPGFSVVAIDPHGKDGVVIVEFHGLHNESETDRMHIELTRRASEHWYDYWTGQFEHLWSLARPPGTGQTLS